MCELVEGVLVDEWHQTDHKRDTTVPSCHVGVAAILQQHIEEIVPELQILHVPEDIRERAVTLLVDGRPRSILQQKPNLKKKEKFEITRGLLQPR